MFLSGQNYFGSCGLSFTNDKKHPHSQQKDKTNRIIPLVRRTQSLKGNRTGMPVLSIRRWNIPEFPKERLKLGRLNRIVYPKGNRRIQSAFYDRPDRPPFKSATAVRANIMKDCFHAANAKGALVRADHCLRAVGWKVFIAMLANGSKLQHGAKLWAEKPPLLYKC